MRTSQRTCCRLCRGRLFDEPLVVLKGMPKAAQHFPSPNEFAKDRGRTLKVYQCQACGLVQLCTPAVPYFQEVITAVRFSPKTQAFRLQQIKQLVQRFRLVGKKVLDVGSGSGEMLDILSQTGLCATGLEASGKLVQEAKAQGRRMIRGFIGTAQKIKGGPFDAFVSFNYLEHLPQPCVALRKIYDNTTPQAVGLITVPNLSYLVSSRCFYEFVFDHLSYFTPSTLCYALEGQGFDIVDCKLVNERNDIAAVVRKRESLKSSFHLAAMTGLVQRLHQIFARYRSKGKKVAVWGAGHRTLALLALSRAQGISYIVDSARFKQGKYAPVLHVPIVAPDRLRTDPVDLVLVMVPGLYPQEVLSTLSQMHLAADRAVLRDNKIIFIHKDLP